MCVYPHHWTLAPPAYACAGPSRTIQTATRCSPYPLVPPSPSSLLKGRPAGALWEWSRQRRYVRLRAWERWECLCVSSLCGSPLSPVPPGQATVQSAGALSHPLYTPVYCRSLLSLCAYPPNHPCSPLNQGWALSFVSPNQLDALPGPHQPAVFRTRTTPAPTIDLLHC